MRNKWQNWERIFYIWETLLIFFSECIHLLTLTFMLEINMGFIFIQHNNMESLVLCVFLYSLYQNKCCRYHPVNFTAILNSFLQKSLKLVKNYSSIIFFLYFHFCWISCRCWGNEHFPTQLTSPSFQERLDFLNEKNNVLLDSAHIKLFLSIFLTFSHIQKNRHWCIF